MRHRGRRVTDKAALGLALATLACNTGGSGATADESETGNDGGATGGDGDGDTGGDGDGDTGSNDFELVSARLDASGETVVLTFSEAVGPVDEVDPSDFRISYASPESLCGDNGCTDITTYRDPNFFVGQYYSYGAQVGPFDLVEITPGDQATEVFLRAATALDPLMCDALAYYEMYSPGYTFGLFVHHSPGAIPLSSAGGEALAANGAQWVEQAAPVWYADGNFPNLDPQIEIPCDL
jgi:hypothetical protein